MDISKFADNRKISRIIEPDGHSGVLQGQLYGLYLIKKVAVRVQCPEVLYFVGRKNPSHAYIYITFLSRSGNERGLKLCSEP